MRTRAWAVVAGLLVVGAGLLGVAGSERRDEPLKVSAPSTRNGVTCSVTLLSLNTTLVTDVKTHTQGHSMIVGLNIEGGGVSFAGRTPRVTSVLDEREMEILFWGGTAEMPEEYRRSEIVNAMRGALHEEKGRVRTVNASANLKRFPEKIMRATGVLPVLVAKRMVREKVTMEEAAEAVEIAPGVTFLISKVERMKDQQHVNFSYEVRIKRGMKGVKPGYEPVFAGLVLRDKDGRITQNFSNEQQVDTRDEYILVHKNVGVSEGNLRNGTLEACVFDGIEDVELNFEISNASLVTETKP